MHTVVGDNGGASPHIHFREQATPTVVFEQTDYDGASPEMQYPDCKLSWSFPCVQHALKLATGELPVLKQDIA